MQPTVVARPCRRTAWRGRRGRPGLRKGRQQSMIGRTRLRIAGCVVSALIAVFGVLVAGGGSLAGYLLQRQSNRRLAQEHEDERARLRLDAAMRAGSLLAPGEAGPADPAVV